MKTSILILIVVVLIVGGFAAYNQGYFTTSNNGGVLENSIAKLIDTKTFKVKGKIEADIKGAEGGLSSDSGDVSLPPLSNIKAFLNFDSVVDQKRSNNLKSSSRFVVGVDADGLQITGSVELITAENKIYVKLVSLPQLLLSFMSSLADIQNQWMMIDFNALKEDYGDEFGVNIDDAELEEQLKALTSEVNRLLSEKTLFDVKESYGKEEMGDVTTDHYLFTANREAIIEVVNEYTELTKQYVPEDKLVEYETTVQESLEGFPAGLDQILTATGGLKIDAWIETRTGRLVRVKWENTITPSSNGEVSKEIESVDVLVDVTFSDFNDKTQIEAPEGTKPIQDVLSTVIGAFIPESLVAPEMPELPIDF